MNSYIYLIRWENFNKPDKQRSCYLIADLPHARDAIAKAYDEIKEKDMIVTSAELIGACIN